MFPELKKKIRDALARLEQQLVRCFNLLISFICLSCSLTGPSGTRQRPRRSKHSRGHYQGERRRGFCLDSDTRELMMTRLRWVGKRFRFETFSRPISTVLLILHPPSPCGALPSPPLIPVGSFTRPPHFTFLFFVGMNIDTGAGDRFLLTTGAGVSMTGFGLSPGVLTGDGVRAGGVMVLVVSVLGFAVATGVRAGAGDCAGPVAVLVAAVLDLKVASGVRAGGVDTPVPPALKVKGASGVCAGGVELPVLGPLE